MKSANDKMNDIISYFFDRYNYYLIFFLFFISLFSVVVKKNLIHKLISLSIFQTSAIFLYLTIGFNENSKYPIIIPEKNNLLSESEEVFYNNPLPHVLMLTAIVVGVSTLALGLSIVLAIHRCHKDISLDDKAAN